jgi:hypothetical protein
VIEGRTSRAAHEEGRCRRTGEASRDRQHRGGPWARGLRFQAVERVDEQGVARVTDSVSPRRWPSVDRARGRARRPTWRRSSSRDARPPSRATCTRLASSCTSSSPAARRTTPRPQPTSSGSAARRRHRRHAWRQGSKRSTG